MINSKKGIMWPYILALVTALIIIIVLFGLPGQVADAGTKAALDVVCQQSLANTLAYKPIQVTSTGLVDKNGDPFHIKCSTDYVKTKKQKEKELAFEVALRIDNCRKSYQKYWSVFDLSKRSVCIVCSTVEMPKDEIQEFIPNLKQLRPVSSPGQNYLQYFFGVQDTSRIENEKASYYNLDTGGKLAIVFVAGDESRNHFLQYGDYGVGLAKYKNLASLDCYLLEGDTELKVQNG
jgi:hypothetical protein